MDGAEGINNNWGTYLKNPDQEMIRYFFKAKLSNAIKYFKTPAVEAVPVVDEVEPILNEAESGEDTDNDDLADDDNEDHRKDDMTEDPEEQSDNGSLFTKDGNDPNKERNTKIKLLHQKFSNS